MKHVLSRSLRFRLAFKQTLSFALLVSLFAWGAYAFLARHVLSKLDGELEDRAIAVRSMLQVRDGQARWFSKAADSEVREHFEKSSQYSQLLDDTGQVVETSKDLVATGAILTFSPTARQTLASGRSGFEELPLPGGSRIRIIDVPVSAAGKHNYLLRVGMPLADAEDEVARMGMFIIALVAILLLLHGANCWLMAGSILRPLYEITAAAGQITPFDSSKRLPVFGRDDEIDKLSNSINAALTRLQNSFQRMSEFLRTLSHEIRQPLTVMRAETEQALRVSKGDTNFSEMLSSQLQHVELLARTVSDLMELAQSDSDEIKLDCQTEDLSELVQAAIDGMRLKSDESRIHISGTVQRNIVGLFDAGQLWRLVLNLLDNAIKFTGPDGRIDVALTAHNGTAILSVSDTGCGIPAHEQPRIFERGYRTTGARKSSVPGTGLGLHFARNITQAHGGTIEVISVPGHGSCFRVSLPLRAAPSDAVDLTRPVHEGSIN
ncbi:MAG TPA: HAMP domain-containing sensor histidine kinase [Candidatus Acidoferrales bacterium]|jgi:signal transduction histidine kinase|nr:HAMP domain-containing sensor histidine kinase [Candidatus Acidoferrales bacterium]